MLNWGSKFLDRLKWLLSVNRKILLVFAILLTLNMSLFTVISSDHAFYHFINISLGFVTGVLLTLMILHLFFTCFVGWREEAIYIPGDWKMAEDGYFFGGTAKFIAASGIISATAFFILLVTIVVVLSIKLF